MSLVRFPRQLGPALLLSVLASGCTRDEDYARTTYYERKVAPILQGSCTASATGSSCHVTADLQGNALGNLDTTSYAMLSKRKDLLLKYGPYDDPALLVKALPPSRLVLVGWDGHSEILTTDIPHTGGAIIDATSASAATLRRWLERGAAENNAPPAPTQFELDPCNPSLGSDPLFDSTTDPPASDFALFEGTVNRFLIDSCAAGNCHGARGNPLYLSCSESREALRWNYFAASDYVAADAPASELIRRVLAPDQGGTFHEGGSFLSSTADLNYQAMFDWATAKGGPTNVPIGAGFQIFTQRVQPLLVKRGCMLLPCHSPPAFNGFRLRAGSGGYFGLPGTRANYEDTVKQMAFESPTPNAGRLLAKNLEPAPFGPGILHRGGPLLAQGVSPANCDLNAALNGALDDQDLYCVVAAWAETERTERMLGIRPLSGVVYVRRPPRPNRDFIQDFEEYSPNSDLRLADATLAADGTLDTSGADRSLLAGCGLNPTSADVRRPTVSWDGSRIAFAARSSAAKALALYVMNADGTSCALEPTVAAPAVDDRGQPVPNNGQLVHNFDPAFAPDGTLVFASTRGNLMNVAAFDYSGPQRTPADPAKLNANLYKVENGKVRQLTFLLNQELSPSFKSNGQVLFITEKRAPGFYQLAGRRINLDGGDYHPLIGQRSSVGYNQVTDLIQLANLNFAVVFSDRGAQHGAGSLAIVNRSIGPDTISDSEGDYLVDPSLKDFPSPQFFQHSIRLLDPGAAARPGESGGAYRNPSPLPDGNLLVSFAANVVDASAFNGGFDVVRVDTGTGQRTPLTGLDDPGADELWPVAVFGRLSHKVFRSTPADPAGSAVIYQQDDDQPRTDRAQLTFLDYPLITSLMFQNTRGGRRIAAMNSFDLWESLPPQTETSLDAASPFIVSDQFGKLYARRRLRGNVPLYEDGSARVQVPAGVPLVFSAPSSFAGEPETVHQQREETQYYPGEWVTLSFPRQFFDGFCGGCHGSVSGREHDIAINPDILSAASQVRAKKASAQVLLDVPPGPSIAAPYP